MALPLEQLPMMFGHRWPRGAATAHLILIDGETDPHRLATVTRHLLATDADVTWQERPGRNPTNMSGDVTEVAADAHHLLAVADINASCQIADPFDGFYRWTAAPRLPFGDAA